MSFRGEDGSEITNATSGLFPNIKQGEEIGEFIINIPEKAIGCHTIYLTRSKGNTNVFLTKVEIGKIGIEAPTPDKEAEVMLNNEKHVVTFTPAHVSHAVYTCFEAATVDEGTPAGNALDATITHEDKEFTLAENNSVEVSEAGTLHYMTVDKNGVKSPVNTIVFKAEDTSSIFELEAEEAEGAVEYYNLQGVNVANPTNGLYIRKQGNKITKVIL